MFTGIIETRGTIVAMDKGADSARLRIESPLALRDTSMGESIAVDGCCLTVTDHDGTQWAADLMLPTLQATTLGGLKPGARVNVERAVRADGRLGGHIVQGHVDGVGTVVERESHPDWDLLRVELPAGLAQQAAPKGSIALAGVSLTVVDVTETTISVGIIPHTASVTTLGTLAVGDRVNVETDVLAKYVARLLGGKR